MLNMIRRTRTEPVLLTLQQVAYIIRQRTILLIKQTQRSELSRIGINHSQGIDLRHKCSQHSKHLDSKDTERLRNDHTDRYNL